MIIHYHHIVSLKHNQSSSEFKEGGIGKRETPKPECQLNNHTITQQQQTTFSSQNKKEKIKFKQNSRRRRDDHPNSPDSTISILQLCRAGK